MKKIILISIFSLLICNAFAQFQDSFFVYKAGIPIVKFGFNEIDTITFKSGADIDSIFFYKNGFVTYKEDISKVDSLNRYDKFGRLRDIDGNVYRTIKIGSRTWMAENLKVATLKDGKHIDEITDQASWAAMSAPAMCWYNNDKASSFDRNGALYNWFTVDTKKLCPAGWHIPSQNEFSQLLSDVGADGKLRMPGTEYWTAPNTGATNASGFSMYPSGYRNSARFETLFNYYNYAYFWVSNQYSLTTGKILSYTQTYITFPAEAKEDGYSVRCVKNEVPGITVNNTTKTYGDADFLFDAASSQPGSTFTFKVDSGAAATIGSNGYVNILKAGKVKVKVILLPTDVFDGDSISVTLTVLPKTLTVKVDNRSRVVGQPNPATYSISPSGFVNNDIYYSSDGSIFGTYLTFATTATTGSPVGEYPIIASGTSPNPNYTYVFLNGILSVVNPGPIPYKPVKDVDGNTYKTVVLGSQIWMTENLRTTTLRDGTKLSNTKAATSYSNYNTSKTPAVSWYNNDSIRNYNVNGGLYNWYAVDTKQLCPLGWHVPTADNWDTLAAYLGPGVVGGKMKRLDTSAWNPPNTGATNSSTFDAAGAGRRTAAGVYYFIKSYADWWTSSESLYGAYYTELSAANAGLSKQSSSSLNDGYSIRCVKNDTVFTITNFKDTSVEYGNISIYGYEGIIFQAQSNIATEAIYSVVSGDAVSADKSSNSIGYFKIKKAGTAVIKVTFSATIDYPAFSKTVTVTVRKKTITLKPDALMKIQGTVNPVLSIRGTGFVKGDNSSNIDVLPTATTTATQNSPVGRYLITLQGGSDDSYILQLETDSLQVIAASNALLDVQGNLYRTVTLGSQTWMADNLKTQKFNDNTAIPLAADQTIWASTTAAAYCWYNNDSVANASSGPLYNFYAVQTDKLCPAGWHVPTDADWAQLENFLIANGFNFDGTFTGNKIAKSMASNAVTDWLYPSSTTGDVANAVSQNNRSGFNAKPTGFRSNYSSFNNYNYAATYWTATSSNATKAWTRVLTSSYSPGTGRYAYELRYGFGVRCVKN